MIRLLFFARLSLRLVCILMCCIMLVACKDTKSKSGQGKKILSYTIGNDISNMDPSLITDIESALIATQVYQGLMKFKDDSVDVEPDLAERYEVSDDGLTYTFHLRKNVRFHDGTVLDADVVKFSVTRQMDPHHPYHVPGKMRYANLVFGDPMSTETALVTDISTPDSQTVRFHLARRYIPFLKNLAMTPAAIVSQSAVETLQEDFNTTMVGTGPFRLASYQPDSAAVLVRNEEFLGNRPPLDEIRFRIVRDANIRLNSIRKGDTDVIAGIEPTAVDILREDKRIKYYSEPSMNLGYLSLNCGAPPLDNKLVRQALNYAVDKQYICDSLFSKTSVPAKGMLPPGMLGYDAKNEGYPHNPEKARQLLAQAGYPNGFMIKFSTHERSRVYNPVGRMLAERVQTDLGQVGVHVQIDSMEFSAFLDRQKSGQFQVSNSGWVSDNGDPDNFIYELVGRPDNELNYSNPEATTLMLQAAAEPDENKRAAMYQQADDMIVANPPVVFLNHAMQMLAVRDRVKNFKLHPTAVTHLHHVDVE